MRKLLLLVTSILFTLAVTEMTLQYMDYPKQSWSPWTSDKFTGFRFASHLNQQMTSAEYSVPITTNELGFRNPPISPKKTKRIVILGDSFTFGYGVRQEDTFSSLLREKTGYDVINASIGGFDLIHQVQMAKHYLPQLSPDLVVYMLYLGNDLVGNERWSLKNDALIPKDPWISPANRKKRDIKLLTLCRMLRQAVLTHYKLQKKEWVLPKDYLGLTAIRLSSGAQENYRISKKLLEELKLETQALNSKFLLAFFPFKHVVETDSTEKLKKSIEDFDQRHDLNKPRMEIADWANAYHVAYVDLAIPLREAYNRNHQRLYFQKDGHFNTQGHQVIASALANEISKLIDQEKIVDGAVINEY